MEIIHSFIGDAVAVKRADHKQLLEEAAELVVETAIERGAMDNITLIIVQFVWRENEFDTNALGGAVSTKTRSTATATKTADY